jgi:hypothetical protein
MFIKFCFSVALCTVIVFAGVSEYLNDIAPSPEAKCSEILIIRPALDSTKLIVSLAPQERADAANSLAAAVATHYSKYRIISFEEIKEIESCNSKVIAIQLQEYHTKPEKMGQKSGAITIKIVYFDNATSNVPSKEELYTGNSERNWGDSTPFKDTIEDVSQNIRKKRTVN